MAARSPKLLAAVALVAAVLGAADFRYRPPPPRSADAPPGEFSAGRAREVLRALVGDGQPHSTGSAAAARVRQGIVAAMERLGYSPEIQGGVACGSARNPPPGANLRARIQGRRPGHAGLRSRPRGSGPRRPGAGAHGEGLGG